MESEQITEKMEDPPSSHGTIDFSDTEIAFQGKTNRELKKTIRLFKLMNNPGLVNFGSKSLLLALKLKIPYVDVLVRNTFYNQFCGGISLLDCQKTIDKLYKYDTLTILDFGMEGKSDQEDFDYVYQENLRALEMAASNNSVPVISIKLTGFIDNQVLEKLNADVPLTDKENSDYELLKERFEGLCERALELGVSIFVDAEESWLQRPIDWLTLEMIHKYNKEKAVIYNTYQLYNKHKLEQLKQDHQASIEHEVVFGAKIVRGAYMEKEGKRAIEKGTESPIHSSKADTDMDFDEAIKYCIDHVESIMLCCATHNLNSTRLMAKLIREKGLVLHHPHLNFCQLYGMSDYITFNLANAGYNVAKYLPYGPVKEVMPYLIRRAEENSSVTGDLSRELTLLLEEAKRRGINP